MEIGNSKVSSGMYHPAAVAAAAAVAACGCVYCRRQDVGHVFYAWAMVDAWMERRRFFGDDEAAGRGGARFSL